MMSFEREQLLGRVRGGFSLLGQGSLGVPLLLLAMLGMMILPLPPFLLDLLFTFNIALSIIVLLVCVYALRPLDFAVFPTILLLATLLRLALNVASTRVVLLHGQEGSGAAGKVIEAFGEVVIGGNYVVGMVVFAILMIINFVVVTKGAGRISEVSARFTLDAMPGKQMAIDADLSAGLIDERQAQDGGGDEQPDRPAGGDDQGVHGDAGAGDSETGSGGNCSLSGTPIRSPRLPLDWFRPRWVSTKSVDNSVGSVRQGQGLPSFAVDWTIFAQ